MSVRKAGKNPGNVLQMPETTGLDLYYDSLLCKQTNSILHSYTLLLIVDNTFFCTIFKKGTRKKDRFWFYV